MLNNDRKRIVRHTLLPENLKSFVTFVPFVVRNSG
jgi:ABC-type microcin C transport system permease subunit YejE